MDNNKLVSDLSGILNGLDSSQEQLEKDAFDVINSSDTSLNLVKESISSVEEILKMISELNEIAEESAARIKELEKLSKDIEQFAGVISSISSRTNILSLNASIEAARAGEAGKGFAVVASEIKQLADQSSTNSSEIECSLQALIENYKLIIDKMENTTANIGEQNDKLRETESDFETLNSGIAETTTQIKEINDIVSDINNQREVINEAVLNLSAISEENAASSQEVMASVEELNSIVSIVDDKASELEKMNKELNELVAVFRID